MRPLPLLLAILLTPCLRGAESITVFAAASLTTALQELGRSWEEASGVAVVGSFAASSTLAKQIEHGAPADLFLSADMAWMDYLAERGRIDAASRVALLGNALVLVVPAGHSLQVAFTPGFPIAGAIPGRLALGDPASVPAGRYAREAFTALGWWEALRGRLAPAADVRAALRLVETGEAEAGVVYATDAAMSRAVAVAGTIPAALHTPVRYPAALVADAKPAAAAFLAFLRGPAAGAVFTRLGFTLLAPP